MHPSVASHTQAAIEGDHLHNLSTAPLQGHRTRVPTMVDVTDLPHRASVHPRHGVQRRRHPLLRGVGVALTGLLAFLISGTAFAYTALQGNIQRTDVSDLLGADRPAAATPAEGPVDPTAGKAVNILVMGSDVRSGDNAAFGSDVEGMRSDTTLLVHVSADRSRADIVSIPRDLLVDIPSCALPNGQESPEQYDAMFNSAFATGGQGGDVAYAAACTIRTVEQMAGVYVDDFVVVDFTGFIRMVDALGGVPMCIPENMESAQAELDLAAGFQTLDGHDALAYARARKNVGDGSDISRIGRQQLLLGAMVRQVLSKNLLTDLPALYQFLDAATESVTAGPTIGRIPNMVGLANSLRGVPAGGVSFVTVPFAWAGARVIATADADALWASIASDEPIAPLTEEASGGPTAGPASDPETTSAGESSPAPTTPTPTVSDRPWDVVTGADEAGICS